MPSCFLPILAPDDTKVRNRQLVPVLNQFLILQSIGIVSLQHYQFLLSMLACFSVSFMLKNSTCASVQKVIISINMAERKKRSKAWEMAAVPVMCENSNFKEGFVSTRRFFRAEKCWRWAQECSDEVLVRWKNKHHMCVLSLWQQYLNNSHSMIDNAPLSFLFKVFIFTTSIKRRIPSLILCVNHELHNNNEGHGFSDQTWSKEDINEKRDILRKFQLEALTAVTQKKAERSQKRHRALHFSSWWPTAAVDPFSSFSTM